MWSFLFLPLLVLVLMWVLYELVRFQGVLKERTGIDLRVGSTAGRGVWGGPPTWLDTWLALWKHYADPTVQTARSRAGMSVLTFVAALVAFGLLGNALG